MRIQLPFPFRRRLVRLFHLSLLSCGICAAGCEESQSELIIALGNIPGNATNLRALVRLNPISGSNAPVRQVEPTEHWPVAAYQDSYKIGLKLPASDQYSANIAIGAFEIDSLLTAQLIDARDLSVGRHELAGGLPELYQPASPRPTPSPYIYKAALITSGSEPKLTISGWGFQPDSLTSTVRIPSANDPVPTTTGKIENSPNPLTIEAPIVLPENTPVVTYAIDVLNPQNSHTYRKIQSFGTEPPVNPLELFKITSQTQTSYVISDYTVADVDGDGNLDLVIAGYNPSDTAGTGFVSFFKNIDNTEFRENRIFQFAGSSPSVIVGKFTQGTTATLSDIAVAVRPTSGAGAIYILKQSASGFSVHATLPVATTYDSNRAGTFLPYKIITANLNTDIYPDIVAISNPSPNPLDPNSDIYKGALLFWENGGSAMVNRDICIFESSIPLALSKARVSNAQLDDIIVASSEQNFLSPVSNSVDIFASKPLGGWPKSWHYSIFPDSAVLRYVITGRPSNLFFGVIGSALTDKPVIAVATPFLGYVPKFFGANTSLSLLQLSSSNSWTGLSTRPISTPYQPFDFAPVIDKKAIDRTAVLISSLKNEKDNFSVVNYLINDGKSIDLDIKQQKPIDSNGIDRMSRYQFTKDALEDTLIVNSGTIGKNSVSSPGTFSVRIGK